MKKIILLFLAFSTLYSCSTDEITELQVEVQPNLIFNIKTPPIEISNGLAFYSSDIQYGEYDENTFDIFFADSPEPTPLVIFIHGGGFVGGDKSQAYTMNIPSHINNFLNEGISFATINYRLLDINEDEGILKCFNDSKRALQFIRYYASSLNIDPDKIAVYGSSAGAGTSLWLGLSDDMADLSSPDPVLRESTRIQAIGATETQATYDLVKWETEVFDEYGFTLDIATSMGLEPTLSQYYGINSFDDLYTPEIIEYRQKVDLIGLMDSGDPHIWLKNAFQPDGVPLSSSQFLHHPVHAQLVYEYANSNSIENVSYVPMLSIEDPSGLSIVEFFTQRLID